MKYYINQYGDTVVKCLDKSLQVIDSDSLNTYFMDFETFAKSQKLLYQFKECDKLMFIAIRDRFIKNIL